MANTRKVALGGILLALTVIILYAESVMPTSKLSLYALSSFFVSVIVIESGIRAGWIFYVASSLLALIIIPDKIALIPYLVFFWSLRHHQVLCGEAQQTGAGVYIQGSLF